MVDFYHYGTFTFVSVEQTHSLTHVVDYYVIQQSSPVMNAGYIWMSLAWWVAGVLQEEEQLQVGIYSKITLSKGE